MGPLVFININYLLLSCVVAGSAQLVFEKTLLSINFRLGLLLNFSIKKLVLYRRYRLFTLAGFPKGTFKNKLNGYERLLKATEHLINSYRQDAEHKLIFWRRRVLNLVEGRLVFTLEKLSLGLGVGFIVDRSSRFIQVGTSFTDVSALVINFLNKESKVS